jgi:hypothetical protein
MPHLGVKIFPPKVVDAVSNLDRIATMGTAITVRVTVYGIFRGSRFVAAFATKREAETVAAGILGICQIVPLTGKMNEQS